MLDDELQAEMKKELPADVPSIFISSVANKNIEGLKDLLWREINRDR
jgi:GTP-binding protein